MESKPLLAVNAVREDFLQATSNHLTHVTASFFSVVNGLPRASMRNVNKQITMK